MKFCRILCMLIFASLFWLSNAAPAPIVHVEESYYSVSGYSAEEIRSNLDERTPVRKAGRVYDARTDWSVRWNFWWKNVNGTCRIRKVSTEVRIRYTLPRLETINHLPGSLGLKWDNYYRALLHHEKGHADFGIMAAKEIESAITNMDAESSCEELELKANEIGNRILDEILGLEMEYDEKTNYGANGGARFP